MGPISFPYMGYQFMINKTFSLFGLEIAFYGVLIAVGMVCGALLAYAEARRTGQRVDDYIDYTIFGILSAIIGARLYYVIFDWEGITGGADGFWETFLAIINLRSGGLAIYGGVIGGLICLIIFAKVKKLRVLQMIDTIVPGLLIGQIIGRWGNFINREAFGGFDFRFFGWTFDVSNVPILHNFTMRLPISDLVSSSIYTQDMVVVNGYVDVLPTFFLESLGNLIILILILIFRDKKKFYGETGCRYMIGYGILRFFIEGFRTDQLTIGNVAVSQVLSLLLAIAGLAIILIMRYRLKGKPALIDPIPTKEEIRAKEAAEKAEAEARKNGQKDESEQEETEGEDEPEPVDEVESEEPAAGEDDPADAEPVTEAATEEDTTVTE